MRACVLERESFGPVVRTLTPRLSCDDGLLAFCAQAPLILYHSSTSLLSSSISAAPRQGVGNTSFFNSFSLKITTRSRAWIRKHIHSYTHTHTHTCTHTQTSMRHNALPALHTPWVRESKSWILLSNSLHCIVSSSVLCVCVTVCVCARARACCNICCVYYWGRVPH